MALAASAAGLVICCFIKDPSASPANRDTIPVKQYIQDTLRLPKLKLFTILSMMAHAVLFMTVFGFTPLFIHQLGMGDAELLWVMSAFFLPHAAATLSFVFLRFTSRIAYFVMLISFAVTGVCLLFVPFSAALFTVCITHACIGLALGFVFPLLLSRVVDMSSARLKMSVKGFYQSFYALGIFLGPLLAGKIAQLFGLAEVFYGAGLLAFAAFLVMLAQKRNMIN